MDNKKDYLLAEIEKRMSSCEGYDNSYCDSAMCSECGSLDKNLRIEIDKEYDLCSRCNGYASVDIIDDQKIITRSCYLCGGTGRFVG